MTEATDDPLAAWSGVAEGFAYPALDTAVTAERQRHYHAAAGIPPERFGSLADPNLLSGDVSLAQKQAGLPNDGRVQLRHRIRQERAIRLDEPLRLTGEVQPWGGSPRGPLLRSTFGFAAADGSVPLTFEMEWLLPRPADAAPRRAPARTDDPRAGLREVAALALTPERVTAFSRDAGNLIHTDAGFARARGFRAPIAQGIMQVTVLIGVLAEAGVPDRLDLDARFVRPAFWDETITIHTTPDRRLYRVVNAGGRVTMEADVRVGKRIAV